MSTAWKNQAQSGRRQDLHGKDKDPVAILLIYPSHECIRKKAMGLRKNLSHYTFQFVPRRTPSHPLQRAIATPAPALGVSVPRRTPLPRAPTAHRRQGSCASHHHPPLRSQWYLRPPSAPGEDSVLSRRGWNRRIPMFHSNCSPPAWIWIPPGPGGMRSLDEVILIERVLSGQALKLLELVCLILSGLVFTLYHGKCSSVFTFFRPFSCARASARPFPPPGAPVP